MFLPAAATALPETAMAVPSPNQTSGATSGGPEDDGRAMAATQQQVEDVKARQPYYTRVGDVEKDTMFLAPTLRC